ncbi:MAG: DUF2975 domain-containing protein [Ruminococcaceae bacterium]|nr:DUF2975 domain-containing protein [Oscillospiraceae bacterium]
MKPKHFSFMMKFIIIALAIFGTCFYAIMPNMVRFIETYNRFGMHDIFYPWIIVILLTAIPCYAVLLLTWPIAVSVKKETQFSFQNATRLKKMAVCALVDGGFFFLACLVFWICGILFPAVMIFSVLILLVAIAFAAVATVLAGMVEKAAVLQEDSDLTI